MMRRGPGQATILSGLLLVMLAGPARAQTQTSSQTPSPVIEVNREIGFGFSDQLMNYKEHIGADDGGGYDRELGWVPGFDGTASAMFDLGPFRHLYVGAAFIGNEGSVAYHGAALAPPHTPIESRSGATFKEMRVELGRGFLLPGQVLLTPVVQFGYRVWNRGLDETEYEDYRHFLLGLAVHADYAATRRLVLRGRLGWAETLQPAITIDLQNPNDGTIPGVQADLRSRPVWQVSGGLDYRVYRALHAYGQIDYERYSYGQSSAVLSPGTGLVLEPNSSTGLLTLSTGLAIGF